MKAGAARTDDVMERSTGSAVAQRYNGIRPCCAQDRHRPLTRRPKGAKT